MAQTDKYAVIEGKVQQISNDRYVEGYNTGYAEGDTAGYLRGSGESFDAGEQFGRNSERNTFWNAVTDYGNRTDYSYGFYGKGWNDTNFKPQNLIQPINATAMFRHSNIVEGAYTDLLDFSKVTNGTNIFVQSTITKLKKVDFRNLQNFTDAWSSTILYIEEFYPPTKFTNMFYGCHYNLKHVIFCSEIVQSFELFAQTTDKETFESMFYWLSPDVEGKYASLSRSAVRKAYETSVGKNDGDSSEEWLNKVASRPNWRIGLN